MIRSTKQYEQAKRDLSATERTFEAERRALRDEGLSPEEAEQVLSATLLLSAQLRGDVEWYERALRGEVRPLLNFAGLGRMLIALRIAQGVTQKELADRLGVSEAQVSQDERYEYHGIGVDRAGRVLDALGAELRTVWPEEDRSLTWIALSGNNVRAGLISDDGHTRRVQEEHGRAVEATVRETPSE